MSSPYRQHERVRERAYDLRLHPEVWASVVGALVITFVAGFSLCAMAEETLGLAAGTLLLFATLAMSPLVVMATQRRPNRLELDASSITLVYPGGRRSHIERRELLVHRVGRGRVALDRERTMVIYVDELERSVRDEIVSLLTDLAGYDVLSPELEARRLALRSDADLRFEMRVDMPMVRGFALAAIAATGVVGFLIHRTWWVFVALVAAKLAHSLVAHLEASVVVVANGKLRLEGFFLPDGAALSLDTLRVAPARFPGGLTLSGGVTLRRLLFARRDWETLVAILSRALGYDVTAPAAEAARLARLAKAARGAV